MRMKRKIGTGVILICMAGLSLLLCGLFARGIASYSYEDMQRELLKLKARYPDTLELEVIGYTHQNRAIYAARAGDPRAKRHVLIQASIHAREYMTTQLAMQELKTLLSCGVSEGLVVHILPMTNPDGVAISQTMEATPALLDMYEQDKRLGFTALPLRQYLRTWKANAAGVDLNRNFDAQWGRIDTRPYPSSANYRGSRPESEPETHALAAYARKYPFGATVSYHATGSEIYYDFGDNPEANAAGYRLGRLVAEQTGYRMIPDDGTSFGGFKDWAIERLNIPSLTIEVGKRPTPLPFYEFPSIWRKNKGISGLLNGFTARRAGREQH